MNVRIGACLFGLAIGVAGCAGGAGPAAIQPQAIDEADLPDWVLALPEGEAPRDTNETNQAALFLAQGRSEDDPVVAQGFFEQSIAAAEAGIQLDPTNATAYAQAGLAYIGLDDLSAADGMFTQAETIYPRYILDTQFFRETEWIENFNVAVGFMPDNAPSAIAALERAHQIYRGRPEAMVQLGGLYTAEGREEDALRVFTEARELIEGPIGQREDDPTALAAQAEYLASAKLNQAQLLFDLDRFSEAAEAYEVIVADDPTDFGAATNLGASLVAGGDVARAEGVYGELLQRPGLSATDYNMIAVGAYNGDLYTQAADGFGRAHRTVPEARDFLFNQAQSLYLAEDAPEELIDVATRLLEIDTHNRNAHRFLAQAMIGLDREQEAVAVLEQMESLPFEISGLQLVPVQGGYALPGLLTNWNADAGSSADIRFRFYDPAGAEVGLPQDVSYSLGEAEQPMEFQVDFVTEGEVIGYSYQVLN